MQIHELNDYNGNLDSNSFVAIDNGADTGKLSTQDLLAGVNGAISGLDSSLNARIDNIIAGGTAPSAAEVQDARLGADGVTYPSLGDAIRTQITDLQNDIDYIAEIDDPLLDLLDDPVSQGYLNTSDGSFVATSGGSPQYTTGEIQLTKNVAYTLEITAVDSDNNVVMSNPRAICVYDENDSFVRYIPIPSGLTNGDLTLTGSESYIRINYNKVSNSNTVTKFEVYPLSGKSVLVTLQENVVIPQIEAVRADDRYIGARRCVIGFILDGEYDLNATMENLFYSNGVKIGFAPQFTTSFPNNRKDTYLAWQRKGHEILAHSTYELKDGNYDDATAEGYIKSAYTIFTGYGFLVSGLIGSGGKIADKYIPTVKKYFRYCASENNHSGSYSGAGAESCLFFADNSPFHLWRYSMQSSTLAQMKAAVDRAISQTGLLLFYGHANSASLNNFTPSNVQDLLDYIASKSPDIEIMTPGKAINEFYSIRYEDLA